MTRLERSNLYCKAYSPSGMVGLWGVLFLENVTYAEQSCWKDIHPLSTLH